MDINTETMLLYAVLTLALSLVLSVAVAAIASYFMNWEGNRRIASLTAKIENVEAIARGSKGNSRAAEKNERKDSAMIEALAIFQDNAIPDKMQALKALGLKYPDVAMDLLKKGGL